jgi:hypothetical protein
MMMQMTQFELRDGPTWQRKELVKANTNVYNNNFQMKKEPKMKQPTIPSMAPKTIDAHECCLNTHNKRFGNSAAPECKLYGCFQSLKLYS